MENSDFASGHDTKIQYKTILHTSLWSLLGMPLGVIFKAFNSASAVQHPKKTKDSGVAAASRFERCALYSIRLAVPSPSNAT